MQHAIEVDHQGMTLRGMVYRPEGTLRCPAALLLHGFTGHRIETGFLFVRLGRALAAAGVAAVTFDFLHSGESDGSYEQMTATGELADALHMTTWLRGQPWADRRRLGLVGFSLGGLLAGCMMARTDAYRALALIAPTTEANMCRHAGDPDCDPQGEVARGPHVLNPQFFADLRSLDAVRDLVDHPRSTLVVQGTDDTAVSPQVSQAFVDALHGGNVPCEHVLVDGANHAFNRPAHQRQLLDSVTSFLTRHLR